MIKNSRFQRIAVGVARCPLVGVTYPLDETRYGGDAASNNHGGDLGQRPDAYRGQWPR